MVTGRAGLRRYELGAAVYDLVSLEWSLYGPPRHRAIDLLDPKPGAVVLDLACGTGLAFPALQSKIGPHGRIIGLDTSTAMLTRARSRTERAGWRNVELAHAPAADFEAAIYAVGITATDIDAVLAAYALSVMDRWRDTLASTYGRSAARN